MKIVITFFDNKGTTRFDFSVHKAGQSTKLNYVETLKRLHEAVRRKRPELWPNNWILPSWQCLAQKAPSLKKFLAQESITEMKYKPYSHYLVPNDL
jgi:hypothetical protein